MSDLLTSVLAKVPNAVTNAPPAVALIAFAGSPSYHMAFKGQKSTDQVYFDQAGPIANTLTDAQPALAAIDVFLTQALILAWKVAGKQTVEVRQYTLGEDGFPVSGSSWVPLTTTGGPANPAVQTDTAPALAIGANSQIYLAWKTPGPSGTVNWSVYDGQGWSAPAAIPQAVTDHAPAFAGWNTSGPGNVLPLCLAWKQASGYSLFWSSFLPGATNLSVNQVPGVATDAAPALTPGPIGEGAAYYLAWKDQGAETISFAPVKAEATGAVLTLPQARSSHGPSIANWSNNSASAGDVFNTLIVDFAGLTSGDVWQGEWSVVASPATAPSGGLKGSSNYFLASGTDCATLTGVVVTITISEPLAYSNGYSFQLNCNSPTSAPNYQRCSWQQCGWQVDSTGQLQFWINNYTVNDGNSINTPYDSQYTITKLPSTSLPARYVLTITLDFDKTNGNLIGTTFGATDENGHAFPSKYVGYVGLPLETNNAPAGAKVTDQYLAPISALQLTIDGFDNLEFATFKSGAGTVSFKADQKLTAQPSIPSCANQTTTGENSNILYGAIPSGAGHAQSQLFDLA
ncbi:MAG: hypothetical protein ABSE86_17350 [Bryobacteraceae bacterium]